MATHLKVLSLILNKPFVKDFPGRVNSSRVITGIRKFSCEEHLLMI